MTIEMQTSDGGPIVVLPSALDLNVADELLATLLKLETSNDAYWVDGSAVSRVGTSCLQVLMSALKGHGRLSNPSDSLMEAVIDLGLLPIVSDKVDVA